MKELCYRTYEKSPASHTTYKNWTFIVRCCVIYKILSTIFHTSEQVKIVGTLGVYIPILKMRKTEVCSRVSWLQTQCCLHNGNCLLAQRQLILGVETSSWAPCHPTQCHTLSMICVWVALGGGWVRPWRGRRNYWTGCNSANTYLCSTYYHVPGTALGSVGSAETKTETVTVLMELQVSQEDMRLTNEYQRLVEQAHVWNRLQRGDSRWVRWEGWRGSLTLGGAREGLPEDVRLQLRPVRRKEMELVLALTVDPRVMGKLGRRPKQRSCFTSFVITWTSSKGTVKKRENGFRSCYFLPP